MGLSVKDIHEEMSPLYGGKCLSRKEIQNWIEKFFKELRQQSKDPYAAAFDAFIKRWNIYINVGGGYVEK
jgi:hypothetical protein